MTVLKDYRILVFDLDGTLFYRDQQISENVTQKLIELQEKGIIVGLATGLFLSELEPFIKQLKIDEYKGFVITANGCEVYDFLDHKTHKFEKIPKDKVNDLVSKAKDMGLISYVHEDDKYHVFAPSALRSIHKACKPVFMKTNIPLFMEAANLQLDKTPNLNKEDYDKICFAGTERSIKKFTSKILDEYKDYVFYPVSSFATEITHKSVSKYSACTLMCKKRNLSLNNVVFFGDGGK